MMLLRKIGICCMALLLFLLFVITEASIIRSTGRSAKILLACLSGSGSYGHITSAILRKQISQLYILEPTVSENYFSNLLVSLIYQSEGAFI